jgi:hypothetical protein
MHEKAKKLPAGAGSGGVQKMPYKGKPGDKNPIIDMKRKELAKKKAEIIRGQNDRIPYGNALHVTTNKNGVQTSNPIGL